MHQLPCPNCQRPIEVSPAQAGEQTTCPDCGAAFSLPTLGQLKQLPQAESSAAAAPGADTAPASVTSAGRRGAFVTLAMIATAAGLIAAFCTVRWALIDVPTTTERHIEEIRAQYQEVSAAQLVREWEDLEKRGLELVGPMQYRQRQLTKQRWGRSAAVAAAICLGAALAAGVLAWAPGGARSGSRAADT